jgi:hypothetical protein
VAAAAAASATERGVAREGQRQDKREGEPSRGRGRRQMERRGGGEDGECEIVTQRGQNTSAKLIERGS